MMIELHYRKQHIIIVYNFVASLFLYILSGSLSTCSSTPSTIVFYAAWDPFKKKYYLQNNTSHLFGIFLLATAS